MNQWERKALRDWIKNAVYVSIAGQIGSLMQMGGQVNISLTHLSLQAYYQMIAPNTSKKSRIPKKKSWGRKKR
jgi:hypothetical protein